MLNYQSVEQACKRIEGFAQRTPVVHSRFLNHCLGQEIFFKCECLQTTGAFKIRGASNLITHKIEQGLRPNHLVASSSGNHAQAVAYVANKLGIKATIFASDNISAIKAAATRAYGAKLVLFSSRPDADAAVKEAAKQQDTIWVPPFNHPDIIAGQATAAKEAIEQVDKKVDAVFAPCGGGGLLSGTYIATRELCPDALVLGAEPLAANDAACSLRSGNIERLSAQPNTLADGAATPSIGEHTFEFLKKIDGLTEVTEDKIIYWTQWLHHLLKLHIEPTCAMTMQAVLEWAKTAPKNSRAMVIISGGNISQQSMARVWQNDQLTTLPSLELE